MDIEKWVTSLETSLAMAKLNFPQKSIWRWYTSNGKEFSLGNGEIDFYSETPDSMIYASYTSAELGIILGGNLSKVSYSGHFEKWRVFFDIGEEEYYDTEVIARSELAIYLRRNDLL